MKLSHHSQHTQRSTVSEDQPLPKPTRVLGFAIFAACLSVAWTQTVLAGVSGALPGGVLLCLILPLLWRAFFPRQ
jgi:hypothetical protein